MEFTWQLWRRTVKSQALPPNEYCSLGEVVEEGTIRDRGYDAAAEDKLIPQHPGWLHDDILDLSPVRTIVPCSRPTNYYDPSGCLYTVGSWRNPNKEISK